VGAVTVATDDVGFAELGENDLRRDWTSWRSWQHLGDVSFLFLGFRKKVFCFVLFFTSNEVDWKADEIKLLLRRWFHLNLYLSRTPQFLAEKAFSLSLSGLFLQSLSHFDRLLCSHTHTHTHTPKHTHAKVQTYPSWWNMCLRALSLSLFSLLFSQSLSHFDTSTDYNTHTHTQGSAHLPKLGICVCSLSLSFSLSLQCFSHKVSLTLTDSNTHTYTHV
jgi:hypothetical protein